MKNTRPMDLPSRKLTSTIVLSIIASFAIFTLATSLTSPTHALVDEWETSFDSDGRFYHGTVAADVAYDIAVQPDGKIIAAGSDASDGYMIRVDSAGVMDNSFGTNGEVFYDGPDNLDDEFYGMALQADGKIVVVGFIEDATDSKDLAVWRYDTDGTLDTGFATNGVYTYDSGTATNEYAEAVAITSDGRIYAVGTINRDDSLIVSLNANGTPNTNFDSDGVLTYDFSGITNSDFLIDIVLYGSNDFFVSGVISTSTDNDMIVAKYSLSGVMDSTYGTGGFTSIDAGSGAAGYDESGNALDVHMDGRVIVAGFSQAKGSDYMVIWRLTAQGDLDTSFNSTGYANAPDALGVDVKILFDEEYVVVGAGEPYAYMWRYNNDGSPDTTLDSDGVLEVAVTGNLTAELRAVQVVDEKVFYMGGLGLRNLGTIDFNLYKYNLGYQIANLDSSLDGENVSGTNLESTTSNYVAGTYPIYLKDVTGCPIALANVLFDSDPDWTQVSAGTSLNDYKAYTHNLYGSTTKVSQGYYLYVPRRSGDNAVGFCPDTTSLAEVTPTCTGHEIKPMSGSDVDSVSYEGREYFRVAGVTGSGGYSTYYEDDTLSDTGEGVGEWVALAGALLVTGVSSLIGAANIKRKASPVT